MYFKVDCSTARRLQRMVGHLTLYGFLGCWSLLTAQQAPDKAPTARKTGAPTRSAAGRKPFTKAQVSDLLKASPDDSLAKQIELRGLAFEPEESWIETMQKTVPQSAKPQSYRVLMAKVRPAPTVEQVSEEGPKLIDQLRDAVKVRDDEKIAKLVHPELLEQRARLFDMMEVAKYQKHQLGKFVETEGRRVSVPVYVVTTDPLEKFYYVSFSNYGGHTVVREIATGETVQEVALKADEERVVLRIRDLYRDLNQDSDAAAKIFSTKELLDDINMIGGWRRLRRNTRLDPEKELQIVTSVPTDQRSLRIVAHVTHRVQEGAPTSYIVDVERMKGDELKAVRVRDVQGKDVAIDKKMDTYLCERYGVTGCQEVRGNFTEDVRFISINRLQDYVLKAIEDDNVTSMESYQKELEDSFPPQDGKPLGLKASAQFLRGDNAGAYRSCSEAFGHGGTVYFRILHHNYANEPLRPATLAISTAGVQFIGNSQTKVQNTDVIRFSDIKKFEIPRGRVLMGSNPFLHLETVNKQQFNFAAIGSVCGVSTVAPGPNLIRWDKGAAPCLGTSTQVTAAPTTPSITRFAAGGAGQIWKKIPGTTTPSPNSTTTEYALYVPKNWMNTLDTIVRCKQSAEAGGSKTRGPEQTVR